MIGASPFMPGTKVMPGAVAVTVGVTGAVETEEAPPDFARFIKPSAAPVWSGSIPYSAGSTVVKKMAIATRIATAVALRICCFEGPSMSTALVSDMSLLIRSLHDVAGQLVGQE